MARAIKALNEVPTNIYNQLKAQGFSDSEIVLIYLTSKVFPVDYLKKIENVEEKIEVAPQLLCRGSEFPILRCYAAADRLAKKGILVKKDGKCTVTRQSVYYIFNVNTLLTILTFEAEQ